MNTDALQSLVEEQSISDADLRKESEKSSRTTFNISQDAVEDLSWLADYYGATQKRIVDHILHILQAMQETEDPLIEAARDISPGDTVRKAVAIDPDTRSGLNRLSDELDVSRDSLVEVGIRLAKMFAEKHMAKQKKLLDKEIRDFYHRGCEIEDRLDGELGSDDPLSHGFRRAMTVLDDVIGSAESALDNDRSIEIPF
jgi:hypothetical protein